MNRTSLPERIAIGLARFIAGPERRHWLDAMEAELDYLPTRRFDWVAGMMVAAAKDRTRRDLGILAAIVGASALAVATFYPMDLLRYVIARLAGVDGLYTVPLVATSPIPAAFALGIVTRRRRLVPVTVAAFAIYQLVPPLVLTGLWGWERTGWFSFLWSPDLRLFGLEPADGLPITIAMWFAGVALGRRWASHRPMRRQ